MSAWLDSLTGWLTAQPEWLGLAIFLTACVECVAVLGVLLPGGVLMFAFAAMAGSGALPLGQTLLLGYLGGLLGDALSYFLGRHFHEGIRRLPVLRHHPEWLIGAEVYFQRYGIASLLVGRYIGPLRPMLPMIAGMLDMPLLRFVSVSLLAAAGWATVYLLPGWTTGAALRLPLPEGFWREAGVVLVTLAVILGLIVHASLQRRRRATLLSSGLCLAALGLLLLGWSRLHELDQGLLALAQAQRHDSLDWLMTLITCIGDSRTLLSAGALLGLLLLASGQRRAALFAILTLLGTTLTNSALKALIARSRPDILLEPLQSYSLPSGHSSSAFAFFLVLGILAGRGQPPRMRLAWLLLAGLPALSIALSRVYLGVHWPTDIIAGALLGGCLCAASLTLVQRHQPLEALSPRTWWLILPLCLTLLAAIGGWTLPEALLHYRHR